MQVVERFNLPNLSSFVGRYSRWYSPSSLLPKVPPISTTPPVTDKSMVLASMSAWLPFPNPDASVETLRRMLDPMSPPETAKSGGNTSLVATPASGWAGMRDGLLSLGPSASLSRKMLLRGSRASAVSAGVVDDRVQVFSRKMVARGLTCPRADQLSVLSQVGTPLFTTRTICRFPFFGGFAVGSCRSVLVTKESCSDLEQELLL